jgi:phage gpG-like protein
MTTTIHIDLSKALTGDGLRKRSEKIAEALQRQVLARIVNGGDSEYKFPPLDFDRPEGGKQNPLYDTGSHLHDSITHGIDSDGPWVGSTFIGARVHQFGTKGKGGELPTIVPKKGKALFIPLSKKAKKSVLVKSKAGNMRLYPKRTKGVIEMMDLVKGKDYLFVSHVDIRSRKFLRVAPEDIQEFADIIADGE